eukprot:CAMPEP_0206630724 /NCGR_PEP_ID=MMETSP0325_2-20121206/67739_1 /ASSEMBLY_ACC=CAM_ASM_000347 /TAXON_ID=2866 /ORGANISM="Crypthecodinium cohnii, Strain Seligo" /LENGTH=572 /DNA_ID=CAMNT_0054155629 /DNA_START=153 /DNA_END=1871 /DNA_ORIENTATION=-
MSAYKHLGPDDQVVLKKSTGRYVKNGPWSGQLHPFHERTWRKATTITPQQYCIIQDVLTAELRVVEGPGLVFPGAYEDVISVKSKIFLEVDQYIRITNNRTGDERIVQGPTVVTPEATEVWGDIQEVVYLTAGQAVLYRNRWTGDQTLETVCSTSSQIWVPSALQEVVDVRELIYVLPHEAMVIRDVNGIMTVYNGAVAGTMEGQCQASTGNGRAFFLPAYSKILRMTWSSYRNPNEEATDDTSTTDNSTRRLSDVQPKKSLPPLAWHEDENADYLDRDIVSKRPIKDMVYEFNRHTLARRLESIYVDQVSNIVSSAPKTTVTNIDLRTQKAFFSFQVQTSDNVRLLLNGTIFWQIMDVSKMIQKTADPVNDVWFKCRSVLNAAVSTATLSVFISSFNDIVEYAFHSTQTAAFWSERGLELQSIEVTGYSPIDEETAATLQSMIRQNVQRINDLQIQETDNDVAAAALKADISLEASMYELYTQQAANNLIVSETEGAVKGGREAQVVVAYFDGLNATFDSLEDRYDLFVQHKKLEAAETDMQQLTSGNATLFFAPKDMNLYLQMPKYGVDL